MKIPIPYKIIARRLYQESYCGRLPKPRARSLLRYIFRMPNELGNSIITEMVELSLVKMDGVKSIIIKKPNHEGRFK